jgi:hypothetical protein
VRLRIDSFQIQKADLLALDWGVVAQAQAVHHFCAGEPIAASLVLILLI